MFHDDVIKAYPTHSGDNEVTKELKKRYAELHQAILNLLPPSRERSKGITELEDSCMWVVKAFHQAPKKGQVIHEAAVVGRRGGGSRSAYNASMETIR